MQKHVPPGGSIDLSRSVTDGLITCKELSAPIVYDYLSRLESRAFRAGK